MEEETNENEKVDEGTTASADDSGDKPKPNSLYERTNEATERLEKANAKTEDLLNRQEALYEKKQLGGMSEAGQQPPKKEEVSDKDYAEKAMSGEFNDKK